MSDENTQLLREIRDLLARQESRSQAHIAENEKLYADANRAALRRQMMLMIFGAVLFGSAVALAHYLTR
jgi:hypothetical protein